MTLRDVDYWEDLARREPCFPVLAADGHLVTEGAALPSDEFFATGELDVSTLLEALASLLHRDISLGSVLDFGCGVGRLTLPLARRAGHVTACDIAPTMLTRARENAVRAGLPGIDFVHGCAELPPASFDFICSLCVFEHVRATDGYDLLRRIASLLVPGGIAAIQIPLSSGVRRVTQPARFSPTKSPSRRRMADVLTHAAESPTNAYNDRRVLQILAAAGARPVARFAIDEGNTGGAVLVFERP
jgi:SAM-dependent methyltransferase